MIEKAQAKVENKIKRIRTLESRGEDGKTKKKPVLNESSKLDE